MLTRKAKLEDLERIADFNIQMAEETEGKILDRNIVLEGVKAVLEHESKGFYLIAEDNKKRQNSHRTINGYLRME